MNIQSNINQTLSIAGMLASMNPTLQAKAKQRADVSRLTKQKESLSKATSVMAESNKHEMAQSYLDQTADISKQIFELDPTEANAQSYLKDYSKSTEGMQKRAINIPEEPEKIAQGLYEEELKQKEVDRYLQMYRDAEIQAQENLKLKQDEKRNSRKFSELIDLPLDEWPEEYF